MKKMISLILAASIFAGCASHTSLQKVEDVRRAYVFSLHEINVAVNTGQMTKADRKKLAPTTQKVADAINAAEGVAVSGADATTVVAAANAALDEMLREAGIDPKTLKTIKKVR